MCRCQWGSTLSNLRRVAGAKEKSVGNDKADATEVHRYTVSERLMNAAFDFQETIFDAQSQGGTTRQKLLRAADSHLNKLRLYLRLAHHWKWLNDGQYRHVSGMVGEIGRLLGGWLKKS